MDLMATKQPKRTPIHIEHHKKLDPEKFANKIADSMLDEIDRARVRKGKKPLPEK